MKKVQSANFPIIPQIAFHSPREARTHVAMLELAERHVDLSSAPAPGALPALPPQRAAAGNLADAAPSALAGLLPMHLIERSPQASFQAAESEPTVAVMNHHELEFIDGRSGRSARTPLPTNTRRNFSWLADGLHVLSRHDDNSLRVYSAATATCVSSMPFSSPPCTIVSAARGGLMAVHTADHSVTIHHATTGACVAKYNWGARPVCMTWDARGEQLAVGLANNTARLVRAENNAVMALPFNVYAASLAFSKHGGVIATVLPAGSVALYKTGTGNWIRTLHHSVSVDQMGFSHSDDYFATGSTDGALQVFDANTWEALDMGTQHKSRIRDMHWLDASDRLTFTRSDSKRYVIDAHKTRQIQSGDKLTFCISPDGKLSAQIKDGRLTVNDLAHDKELLSVPAPHNKSRQPSHLRFVGRDLLMTGYADAAALIDLRPAQPF